jgi:hypothetical protein
MLEELFEPEVANSPDLEQLSQTTTNNSEQRLLGI